ncbi:MAG: hypothetical protein Q9225_007490 [Loekoesia sp. 1 TL-2023]
MRYLNASIFLALASSAAVSSFPSPNIATTSPSSSAQSLSLKALLEPVNDTSVKVAITNTYPEQISILHWNNHFQTNQNAAHGSFLITPSDNTGQALSRGPDMGQFLFAQAAPSHFVNITAGSTYTDIFDLTTTFAVPSAGSYNVLLDLHSQATLVTDEAPLYQQLKSAGVNAQNLPSVEIRSDVLTMQLQASSGAKRLTRRALSICSEQPVTIQNVLRKARGQSRNLAQYALNVDDTELYTEYFKDVNQTDLVNGVYTGIKGYLANGNTYGITEYCDPSGNDAFCTDDGGTIAYNTPGNGASSSITFCGPWFSLPLEDTCDYPSTNNRAMLDQGGAYLHELTHSPNLVGVQGIRDGKYSKCYDCGARVEDPPWLIAINYEFHAYASRALSSKSCTVDPNMVHNIATCDECE